MNIVGITGNLTRDIELKKTTSGIYVASFCIAVKRPFTSDKTDFIDCIAFKNKAEFVCKYFGKGSGITVDGILSTRTWEDKEGKKHKETEIICQNIGFMGSNKKEDGKNVATIEEEPAQDFQLIEDEDLPF